MTDLRRRVILELVILGTATAVYLAALPERHPALDLGLALAGLALVGLGARTTRDLVWGPPPEPARARLGRATGVMARFTLPVLGLLALAGGWAAYGEAGDWRAVADRLLAPRVLPALGLYLPWALLQQTLFQFYLLGRLRALLPAAPPLLTSLLNGVLFGAVHLPDRTLALFTMGAGVVWSHAYGRSRSLLPIAASHAVLGAAYFSWVRGEDLFVDLAVPLSG